MTKAILIAVVCGIGSGYFFLPQGFIDATGTLLIVGLSIVIFLVGVDMGTEGTVVANFKKVGLRILAFPLAIIIGSLGGAVLGSLLLPISIKDAAAVSAGFGWYTFAPILLADYSTEISAISFMHNVMREVMGMVLIPIVAQKIGYVETTALPGASTMDVALPIVEKATKSDIVVYSFVTGVILSAVVPILVPFIIAL